VREYSPDHDDLFARFDGKANISLDGLIKERLLSEERLVEPSNATKSFAESLNTGLHWDEKIHRVTAPGREWWNDEGCKIYEKLKAKRDKERAGEQRWILIGKNEPIEPGFFIDKAIPRLQVSIRRPVALARVARSTPSRLYVTDVEFLREPRRSWSHPVKGYGGERYVERADIMLDGISRNAAVRLVSLDSECADDVVAIMKDALEDWQPILNRMNSHIAQRMAEFNDARREFLREIGKDDPSEDNQGPTP